MGRTAKPWKLESENGKRKPGYYAWVRGKLEFLATTEREAKQQLKRLQNKKPDPVPSGSVLEVVDRFLEFVQPKVAERTYEWYHDFLQQFMDSIGNLQLSELKTHHIQGWLDGKDWSDSTKHGAWRAVNRCFRWAVNQEFMHRNPAKGVEKKPPGRRENPMTEEHYKQIVQGTRDQNWRDVMVFSWECGPRPQETVAIEARHYDAENERIVFPKDESKGKKHKRTIYLTPEALEIIKRLTKKWGRGPIFRNTDGLPWTGHSTKCRLQRWGAKLGVKYSLYDIRHAFCDRLLKSGVDPLTVAVLMGHVDTTMVSRIYQHLNEDPAFLRNALTRVTVSLGRKQ